MRLVYTADLHGDIDSYRALLELAVAAGARAAIVGGDLLPPAIKLQGAIESQRDFITTRLRRLLLDFRERRQLVPVYLLAGNDDWAAAIAGLADLEQEELACPLHERVYQLHAGGESDLWLAGYACVPITPFSIKDYERRDDPSAQSTGASTALRGASGQASAAPGGTQQPFSAAMAYTSWSGSIEPIAAATLGKRPSIAEDLDKLAERSDPCRTIYACHTPPANTALDQMARGRHVGSRALRAFIERRQPLLTLHGHIHEAPDESGRYAIRLGDTWSINPGHNPRRFQAVTLDTDNIELTITHTVFGTPAMTR